MLPLTRFFALFVFALAALRADDSLVHARRAQLLLGDTWSQLIRIENHAETGRYPRVVHALVFEVAELLWFYCDIDGTQSFSLHRGKLAQEKSDFAPLLHDIEPGFANWSVVATPEANRALAATDDNGQLPNGCFIESLAALRSCALTGVPMRNPRLLSYYVDTGERVQGHTVLAFETGRTRRIIDPARPEQRFDFPLSATAEPLALARALEGDDVVNARALPLTISRGAIVASATRSNHTGARR